MPGLVQPGFCLRWIGVVVSIYCPDEEFQDQIVLGGRMTDTVVSPIRQIQERCKQNAHERASMEEAVEEEKFEIAKLSENPNQAMQIPSPLAMHNNNHKYISKQVQGI